MAEKANNHRPGCIGWWVIFLKHTTFGIYFFDFLRGKVPGMLEIQADSEKNRKKKYLWEMDQNVVPLVMTQVKTYMYLSDALVQSSRGFGYFEHLNLVYKAAQMQSLTQEDGFYHTFCSTSILSTFLFIGPYFAIRWQGKWVAKSLINQAESQADGHCMITRFLCR